MKTVHTKWCVLLAVLLLAGCKDDKPGLTPVPATATQERNAFAQLLMTNLYLWNREAQNIIVSQGLDYTTEEDPIKFFNKLVHRPDDRWSFMTDDIASMQGSVSGTTTAFGYELAFGQFTGTDEFFAVVLYVYPDTPAAAAGIGRGDLIIGIDGGAITDANDNDLYEASRVSLDMGRYNAQEGWIEPVGEPISLTAVKSYLDPIQFHTVLEEHGRRVGYLCYTQYVCDPSQDAHGDLVRVFEGFKDAGVEDVVLDLRYNGGGYAVTSELLCDILAPQSALDNGEVMTIERWNDTYSKYNANATFGHELKYEWKDGQVYTDRVVNLDLDRVYILTGSGTASASESTIVGLMPYMDVVRIGQTTHGKFCGGLVLDRTIYNETKEIAALENWGAYVMVYEFTNTLGTTFPNGFAPDHPVAEDLIRGAYPFGDTRDPLLGRALELITGEDYGAAEAATRAAAPSPFPLLPAEQTPSANALDGKLIKLHPQSFLTR